jgi:hypothetical protein
MPSLGEFKEIGWSHTSPSQDQNRRGFVRSKFPEPSAAKKRFL